MYLFLGCCFVIVVVIANYLVLILSSLCKRNEIDIGVCRLTADLLHPLFVFYFPLVSIVL